MPSPEEILSGFEEGKHGSSRTGIPVGAVSGIRADGAWGNVLSGTAMKALRLLAADAALAEAARGHPADLPVRRVAVLARRAG